MGITIRPSSCIRQSAPRAGFFGLLLLLLLAAAGDVLPAGGTAWAGDLSYPEVLREALQSSSRIRMKKAEVLVSEAAYRQSLASLYPGIHLNSRTERFETLTKDSGFRTIYGEVIGGNVDEWRSSVYLIGEYPISNWYKKLPATWYYQKRVEASEYDAQVETKRIAGELTDIYGAVSEGTIKLRYGSAIVRNLEEALSVRREAHAAGEMSREELLKAEADLAEAQMELSAASVSYLESLARLSVHTGRTYEDDARFETLQWEDRPVPKDILRRAESTPEYQCRRKELDALRDKAVAARNDDFPDIVLYGRYDFYGNSAAFYESWRDMQDISCNAGIYLSIPIFDGFGRKWEREKTLREIRKQEESVKSVASEKTRDLEALSRSLSERAKTVDHYRRLAARYRQVLDIARGARYFGERGAADILAVEKEVLSVERDLKVAENGRAVTEKKLFIEADFNLFMKEFHGNGSDLR